MSSSHDETDAEQVKEHPYQCDLVRDLKQHDFGDDLCQPHQYSDLFRGDLYLSLPEIASV